MIDLAAGLGIGTAVGLLVGLSTSPVVASTVAALLAIVVTFLGLGGSVGPVSLGAGAKRLLTFSIGLAVFAVVGNVMRAQQWFAPTAQERVDAWQEAGVARDEAIQLVVYERLGLPPPGRTASSLGKGEEHKAETGGIGLFSGVSAARCGVLSERAFPTPDLRLKAMLDSGPEWAALATFTGDASEDERKGATEAAWQMLCGNR